VSEAQAENKEKPAKPAKKEKESGGSKKKKEASFRVATAGETRVSPKQPPRLQVKYRSDVAPALMKKFGYKNIMQVPRLEKVVINCAVKDAVGNPKILDSVMDEIAVISGQRPILTRAKKAIAGFKLRGGIPLGVTVTLRRARMWEFLDRLVSVALPRVRDFKGINPKSFDGRGNYSLGLREQIIFPEINYDKIEKVLGMTVTMVTTAKNNEHARALLAELGMPFRK